MKTGRPAMRRQFREHILNALSDHEYPATVTGLKRRVESQCGRPCGWDTVRKYLDELVAERLVMRQALPAEPGRKPLELYLGRFPRDR